MEVAQASNQEEGNGAQFQDTTSTELCWQKSQFTFGNDSENE